MDFMAQANLRKQKTFIEIDTTSLSQAQVRIIKSFNKLMEHVLKTKDEAEYFEGSAECIRMCAALVKQSEFICGKNESDIQYAEQVIEYSMDLLQESMQEKKIVTYDN